jgi:hypothetical protein
LAEAYSSHFQEKEGLPPRELSILFIFPFCPTIFLESDLFLPATVGPRVQTHILRNKHRLVGELVQGLGRH